MTQLRPDARQKHREAERLRHIIIGARFKPEDRVGIGVMAGQHDDRRFEAALAQQLHGLSAVHVRKADIHDKEINLGGLGGLHRLRGICTAQQ